MVVGLLAEPLIAAALVILLLFLGLYMLFGAFALVGLSPGEVVTILFLAPFLGWLHIPVTHTEGLDIYVNAAGAIVPVVLVVRFAVMGRLPLGRAAVATVAVTAVAFVVSRATSGGIVVLVYPVVLATVLMTALVAQAKPGLTGPVAYTSGALGTLIGADLLHLHELADPARDPPMAASIGGAGTLDAIYLVGIMAVVIQIVTAAVAWMVGRAGRKGTRA